MDDNPEEIRKRSVRIAGHQTSVSLEAAFWRALKKLAEERDLSINQLITEIDLARSADGRTGNLSSAIRVFVLTQTHQG